MPTNTFGVVHEIMMFISYARGVVIPCLICSAWSHFIQEKLEISIYLFCLFVFVALHPMSTAMVIAGRSVHLTTLFPGQA